jgi:hypothetical protein
VKKLSSSICMLLWLIGLLSPAAVAQVIQISNVEELYSAVNDMGNAGTTLVLAPGTYVLSATSNNTPRPNGGRIELQIDMSITGVEGDRNAVVIDASLLPKASFPSGATGPNAAVRMGRGHNAIEWLTVRNAGKAQANIDAGLQPTDPGGASIVVAHVTSTGSARGLNVTTFGSQWANKTLEADIIDSYFFDNASEGVRTGTLAGAQGVTVNVRMSGNLSWGQQTGWLLEHNGNSDATVNAVSSGNRFYANGAGMVILGALSSTGNSNGNAINFEAHGDQLTGNTGFSPNDVGGLVVIAAENIAAGFGGSNNTVNVSLWGCRMLNNTDTDFTAVAARSNPASAAPYSQNNHVTIEIHGDGNGNGKWQPVVFFADNLVNGNAEEGNGNSYTVID